MTACVVYNQRLLAIKLRDLMETSYMEALMTAQKYHLTVEQWYLAGIDYNRIASYIKKLEAHKPIPEFASQHIV